MPRECWCHRVSQDKEPSPSQEEWKVEFVARFPKTPPEDFFIFIGDLLSQARASTLKEVGEVLVGLEKTVFLPLPENAKEFMGDFERGTVGGANYAIRTVIEVLQEKGDKSNTKNI